MDQEGLRGGQLKVSDEQEQVGNLDQREQSHNCNARRASEVQFQCQRRTAVQRIRRRRTDKLLGIAADDSC